MYRLSQPVPSRVPVIDPALADAARAPTLSTNMPPAGSASGPTVSIRPPAAVRDPDAHAGRPQSPGHYKVTPAPHMVAAGQQGGGGSNAVHGASSSRLLHPSAAAQSAAAARQPIKYALDTRRGSQQPPRTHRPPLISFGRMEAEAAPTVIPQPPPRPAAPPANTPLVVTVAPVHRAGLGASGGGLSELLEQFDLRPTAATSAAGHASASMSQPTLPVPTVRASPASSVPKVSSQPDPPLTRALPQPGQGPRPPLKQPAAVLSDSLPAPHSSAGGTTNSAPRGIGSVSTHMASLRVSESAAAPTEQASEATAPQPITDASSTQQQQQQVHDEPQPALEGAAVSPPSPPPSSTQHAEHKPDSSVKVSGGNSSNGNGNVTAVGPTFRPLEHEELTREQRSQLEKKRKDDRLKLKAEIEAGDARWDADMRSALQSDRQEWDEMRADHKARSQSMTADGLMSQQFVEEMRALRDELLHKQTQQLEMHIQELVEDGDEESEQEESQQELDSAMAELAAREERQKQAVREVAVSRPMVNALSQEKQQKFRSEIAERRGELKRLQVQLAEEADKQRELQEVLEAHREANRQRFEFSARGSEQS